MTPLERWRRLSARERYLLLGAVVAGLVVLARYVLIVPLGEVSMGADNESWVRLQKIRNYQRIVARSDAGRKRRDLLVGRYEQSQKRLIEGSTPTQVGAELQGKLSRMAGTAGLNVLSSQILKEEEVSGFRRVGVRLTLSGNLNGVARLVSSIETDRIDLVVTLFEINRKLGASRRPIPSRTASKAPPPSLTSTLEVKTLMLADL